jgi:hypothetical protein
VVTRRLLVTVLVAGLFATACAVTAPEPQVVTCQTRPDDPLCNAVAAAAMTQVDPAVSGPVQNAIVEAIGCDALGVDRFSADELATAAGCWTVSMQGTRSNVLIVVRRTISGDLHAEPY